MEKFGSNIIEEVHKGTHEKSICETVTACERPLNLGIVVSHLLFFTGFSRFGHESRCDVINFHQSIVPNCIHNVSFPTNALAFSGLSFYELPLSTN